ncbi:AbrB/MazE/SpoVT family DNA-binding domain-containing protein [Halobacillus ihumii]|uniref:AbrB/MazE/SpoVT family DNA-binding domain-containing protein n=1 Tax=Halobacillus ihumii TaxID=2686092 RepID=UPI0013CFA472|nr:AbrB/MazE/SpoVT family DNA-binding domain-containing protein [Halobacillus ihumii]
MKATGIVRKVDELGRIVLPIELRRSFGINIKAPMEIYVDDDQIIIKNYAPNEETCQVTGEISTNNLVLANDKVILSPKAAKTVIEDLHNYINNNFD